MGNNMLDRTKKILVISCFIFNLISFACISLINRYAYGTGGFVTIASLSIPVSTVSGTIQSIALSLCVLAVCFKQKLALVLSYVYFSISIISMLVQVIFVHNTGVIPGIFNLCVSLATVTIIAYQFISIEKERITDVVTKLPNRIGANDIIARHIERNENFSVLMVQITNYKRLNDDIGNKYGDMILVEVSRRLQQTVGDRGFVCKFDGAEFCVVVNNKGVDTTARRIVSSLSKKVELTSNEISTNYYLDARVGISEFPKDSKDVTELIKCANIALFHASADNNTKYKFFNVDMQTEIRDYVDCIRKVQIALENDYFTLVYQPQFTSEDKTLRGFETLIRMNLPDGDNVPPGKFIEIAERSDLIVQIDKFVVRRALSEFASVLKKKRADFILSVNVSAKSMAEPSFAEDIRSLITKLGFPASNLEIEITEYSLSSSDDYTVHNIDALRSLGVKFALDDFGTGYTSLSKLMTLKVDLLKIDKSLIDNINETEEHRALVDSVIYMGHLMKCEVIAEGVEEEAQLTAIQECNCDLVQGYIWGRPVPFEDAINIVMAETA